MAGMNHDDVATGAGGTAPPLSVGAIGDVVTGCLLWRYAGQLHLCISVRARYELVSDGVARRSAARGVPGLAAADDAVPYRQGCDVWMVGHCNATPLTPDAPLTTRLTLFGDRERLLERQHRLMHGSDVGVAGYGPRRTGGWLADLTRDGVVEIPQNFDWTQLHAAPVSQRTRHLEGNELLVLEGLLEQRGAMRCRIPAARGLVRVWARGAQASDPSYAIHVVADTLAIDTDAAALTAVWRGSFPIEDVSVASGIIACAGVEEGEPIDWEEGWVIANTAALMGADARITGSTLELSHGPHGHGGASPLPFSVDRPPLRPAPIEGAPWSERSPAAGAGGRTPGEDDPAPRPLPARRERALTLDLDTAARVQHPALPFSAPAGEATTGAPPPSETNPLLDLATVDLETVDTPPREEDVSATPFETSETTARPDGEPDER